MPHAQATSETLSARQQAILPIAAFAAAGDVARLNVALHQGLDAGLTVSDTREVLVQVYAYAGFPRSLNALTALVQGNGPDLSLRLKPVRGILLLNRPSQLLQGYGTCCGAIQTARSIPR
jgi:hypothetical protein